MTEWFEWRDAPASARFAVLGDPISHSLSPDIHGAAIGSNGEYVALRVPAGELDSAIRLLQELGYIGVNITVPLKVEALQLCRVLDPVATRVGAVNTITLGTRSGANTDVAGFVASLNGRSIQSALILGSGGSARAVAVGLDSLGPRLACWARSGSDAVDRLARETATAVESVTSLRDIRLYDLVVNCTSASMQGASLPVEWEGANPDALAYDLFYGPSKFLEGAATHGLSTMDGKEMLILQAAVAFEIWHGRQAPLDAMRRALA